MSTGLYDGCSMGELLVRAIQRGGDRDAFILDDQRITYRAFGELLSRFIQALEARGLRKGDAVATLSANRPEAFLTTAAAYMMGLRITWMHPLASEDDHAYLLEDLGVTTLFVDPTPSPSAPQPSRPDCPACGSFTALVPSRMARTSSPLPPPSSRAGWSRRPRPTTSAS